MPAKSKLCGVCLKAPPAGAYWEWAWQPFGPDETPFCVSFVGYHYRGFPFIPLCSDCQRRLESVKGTDIPFPFWYQNNRYYVIGNEVVTAREAQARANR